MNFTPIEENQSESQSLINPGLYDFEVIDAIEKKSRSGNEMIKLKLKVLDDSGKDYIVYDYLVEAMPHKLRHFAESTGLINQYNLGQLNANDCYCKTGKAEIVISPATDNFPAKNDVKDYKKEMNDIPF